ncbi:serine hydrolase domain-containing protein [Christiangramia salexigens]|uniref:Serine hydrolase n=1 Tax=Christiangramia salexigens TaxID=1913577 RepID=A0A1L3J3E1_9FLAO|nr:serine hydrolase domain-containing protein [Christiangramia salexigens]APG59651.1 serine hydrolase [Christiangramia salexigens]
MINFKPYLNFILCFLCSFGLAAQSSKITLERVIPEETGVSSSRLEKIDQMIIEAIEHKEIPGAVGLISRNGKIIYHKTFGTMDENGETLVKDDIFRIASQTKAITATAVMMLWEEGRFKLDDPISDYIPEFKDAKILEKFNEADSSFTATPAGKEISIRHLLTHTSGIGYGMIDTDDRFRKIYAKAGIIDAFTTDSISLETNIKKLAQLPLHHRPGEKLTYSEGLDVLGYFVEIVSGEPFDKFLKERLFTPLEMNDTYFYIPDSKKDRLVSVQEKRNGKWKNLASPAEYDVNFPIKGARTYFSGGAGLSSTAKDYAKFLQMYLNKGSYNGKTILSPVTVDLILENHTGDLYGSKASDYGLAFGGVTELGEKKGGLGTAETFYWGGYFNTHYFADPETGLIGILLKQTRGETKDQTGWKFRQMVFSSLSE